jgi:hypothetical protein
VDEGLQAFSHKLPSLQFHLNLPTGATLSDSRQLWFLVSEAVANAKPVVKPLDLHFTRLGLRITVEVSRSLRQQRFSLKPIFDGVIAAFHSWEGEMIEGAVRALQREIPGSAELMKTLLQDHRNRILGPRRFVKLSGAKGSERIHQLDPADHLCTAGQLLVAVRDDIPLPKLQVEAFFLPIG